MKEFKSEAEVDAFLTKIAVDCGSLGVEATTKGLRAWLEAKGVFDCGVLSRFEFELAVSVIEREFVNQVKETLWRALKGDENAKDKSDIPR